MNVKPRAALPLFWIVAAFLLSSASALYSQVAPPFIIQQPQGGAAALGTNFTFTVTATALPSVQSGTLQLWLRADAGVVTNSGGLVTEWDDQSGNGNNAFQQNSNQQPTWVSTVDAIDRLPAVRFNGIQDGVHGSFLFSPDAVAVPNAMTTFCLYNAFVTTNSENLLWLIGEPGVAGVYGACRCDDILDQDMLFSTWGTGYQTGYYVPTENYRIWSDQTDTNMDSLEMFDIASNSVNSFSFELGNTSPTSSGYYVGGLNAGGGYVGSSRCFNGDIVEFLVYSGSLSEGDSQAVQNYLNQKYFQGTPPVTFSYQWQLDGTNLPGATDSSLTITNVSSSDNGTYAVIVSDGAGSVTSSNAVLFAGEAVTITTQPQNQLIQIGSNATFSVVAAGTPPFYYQWYFDGSELMDETNSTLIISNVQTTNFGDYAVDVSNGGGTIASSNATLGALVPAIILGQPQSQSVVAGSNITLGVYLEQSVSALPNVASGSLAVWLRADSGVVTNASGLVSEWTDFSGNNNNVSQANAQSQPSLVSVPSLGGNASAVRFTGIQDNVNGSWLYGSEIIPVSNAMTTFCLYNAFSTTNSENLLWLMGTPGTFGASRCDDIVSGSMLFSTWGTAYATPIVVPTNTYRIWTDQLSSNLTTLSIFDDFAFHETNFTVTATGAKTPGHGFYVGGLNPAASSVVNSRCFSGDIVEFLCFKGALSEGDRVGVLNYLYTKYFYAGSPGAVTYQWRFDGTNIAGATNATLTLTNAQSGQAGSYSVVVTGAAGGAVSSNAIVTVNSPPTVSFSPSNQIATINTNLTLTPVVSGALPISFQWQFDGTNIARATNVSLTLTNLQTTNSGTYSIVARNAYGTNTASMTLFVQESAIQAQNATGAGGEPLVIHIALNALGDEGLSSFSVDFNPSVFTYVSSAAGSAATGGAFVVSANNASNGSVGFLVGPPNGTYPPGTNDIVDITFLLAPSTTVSTNSITFGGSPYPEGLFGEQSQSLPVTFEPGTVIITATPFEGDVYPLPNGDESVNVLDWIEEGRLAAGLDSVSNGVAFQKADCAPRATSGDGQITVADWVQVGRYATGLDSLVPAGGPTNPAAPTNGSPSGPSDLIALSPTTQGAATNSVAVTMVARGVETAMSFSVAFDPTVMEYVGASTGSGAPGATLLQNTNQAAQGEVGIILGLLPPSSFSPGTKTMANLTFVAKAYANASVSFGDFPIVRQLVDSNASFLATTFQNTNLTVAGGEPTLTINRSGTNVVLTWSSAATNFTLQTAAVLRQWTNVTTTPAMVGNNFAVTSSVSTNAHYFRLKQ